MVFGGALSLAANILHGHTLGDQIYGGLLVVGFIVVERATDHLVPAPAVKPVDPEVTAKRRAAAAKGAATRRRNAMAKRRPKAPADSAEAARMPARAGVAPVSPA